MQFQGFDWLSGHGSQLYHDREIDTIKLPSVCSYKKKKKKKKSSRSSKIS